MQTISIEGERLSILFPKSGAGCWATGFLLIFMLVGLGFLGFLVLMLLGSASPLTLDVDVSSQDFPLIPFMSLFALGFLGGPLLALVNMRRSRRTRLDPHALVFDNLRQRMEVLEDEDSRQAEAWIPYGAIRGFAMDTYTTSSGSGSSRRSTRWYVATMQREDGSTWDLDESTNRDAIEAMLASLNQHFRRDSGPSSGDTLPWPSSSPLRRESIEQGTLYRWHASASLGGAVFFLAFCAILTWLLLSIGSIADTDAPVWLFWLFAGIFDLVAVLVLVRSIIRMISDQGVLFGLDGISTGLIVPRSSSAFKAKTHTEFTTIKAVAYNRQNRGSMGSELCLLGPRALECLRQRQDAGLGNDDLEGFGELMASRKDIRPLAVDGLRLSEILILEAGLEAELERRGASAL